MKKIILVLIIIITSCSRPFYIKDKHFNCSEKEFIIDSDLKELVYLSLKRAVVIQKDIPNYRSLWKKNRIYVASEYPSEEKHYSTLDNWGKEFKFLSSENIPSNIEDVRFCLKSRKELQGIANKTWEDFLHISFNLIKIEKNKAVVKINNTWIVSNKHPKTVYLSGGGYILLFKKGKNKWLFDKIQSSWIS